MNYIWCIMILGALICSFFTGTTEATINAAFAGAENAVKTLLSLAGIMCFWTGIMNIAQKTGIMSGLKKLLSPVINRLFKGESEEAKELITMNICANMLGTGNAATPMGIRAMSELQKNNPLKSKPSKEMCLFMVLNTTCFTFVPSTVLSLRASSGSLSPGAVIVPIWIVSALSIVISVLAVKVFIKD